MDKQDSQTQLSSDDICEDIEETFLRIAIKNKDYTLKQEVLDAREYRKSKKWLWEVLP